MNLLTRIHARAHHRGLYGHKHIAKQRQFALWMVITGVARTLGWLLLAVCYVAHVPFAVKAFASVSFVALLSAWALVETAWSQAAASWAQLAAGDVHHAVAVGQDQSDVDMKAIGEDLARLADLQPGPEAHTLAGEIRARIGVPWT